MLLEPFTRKKIALNRHIAHFAQQDGLTQESSEDFPPTAQQETLVLKPHLCFYYKAYVRLSRDRQHFSPPTPIPWYAIKQYADYYGLSPLHTEFLFDGLMAMDDAYCRVVAESQDKESASHY